MCPKKPESRPKRQDTDHVCSIFLTRCLQAKQLDSLTDFVDEDCQRPFEQNSVHVINFAPAQDKVTSKVDTKEVPAACNCGVITFCLSRFQKI